MKLKLKVKGRVSGIAGLDPSLRQELDQLLVSGESSLGVASWLKKASPDYAERSIDTVRKQIDRYRKGEFRRAALAKIADQHTGRTVSGTLRKLNALEELQELIVTQHLRVDKALVQEKSMPQGVLLKSATDQIKLLREMLVDLGRLQLETGMIQRAPKTLKGKITMPDGSEQEVSWTEEQERLFEELQELGHDAAEDL